MREIERRLQIARKAATDAPAESTVPVGVPESFDEHIKLQFDLLALAFRGDITRVGTLLYARDLTSRNFPASGVTVGFHGGSHHGEDPKRIDEYSKMNRYHVAMLAHFVEKLAKTQDGDGTILDHSLVLYGTNMGNSNQHRHEDSPHVLVGRRERKAQGRTRAVLPDQDGADREPAGEPPGRSTSIRTASATARGGWRISEIRGPRSLRICGYTQTLELLSSGSTCSMLSSTRQGGDHETACWELHRGCRPVVARHWLGAAGSDVADAVMRGDAATVRALLGQKADVNATQADGATALHWAVYRADPATDRPAASGGRQSQGRQPRGLHAALAGRPERERRHHREPAEGGRGSERAAAAG